MKGWEVGGVRGGMCEGVRGEGWVCRRSTRQSLAKGATSRGRYPPLTILVPPAFPLAIASIAREATSRGS